MSNLDRKFRRHGLNRGMNLPEVPEIYGMNAGFLMGSTIVDGKTWDVVIHPDEKEYSLREQGKDANTGVIVTLTEGEVAGLAIEHGVRFDPKKPPPELAKVMGAMIIVQAGGSGYALTLQLFAEDTWALAKKQLDEVAKQPEQEDAP